MRIPSNSQWTQTNEGDFNGILHSSRNVDLNTPGKVRIGQKSQTIFDNTSVNLGYVTSLQYFNGNYHAVGTDSSGIITFDLEGNVVGATGSEPTLSIYSDALVINSLLWVTISDNLYTYNGTTYTDRSATLTSSVPHPIEIFDSLTTYKVAIGNGNQVHMMDLAYNEAGTDLVLPTQYVVTSLAYNNGYLYVGTRNQNGGDAVIFTWDGASANANSVIPVSGNWVYSVKPYRNSVCAILSSGELVAVSGASAVRLSALPVFYDQSTIWQGTLNGDVPRVFHRGMVTDGDDIYINVEALVDDGGSSDYLPGFESGIWQYTPQTGLNHFASSVLELPVSDASLSVTDSIITTSATHNLKDGDAVIFSSVSGLSGVTTSVKYYVSVQSTTTIKLAKSRNGIKNENYVTITGTAGGSDILEYTPNTEYYQYARVSSGAITKLTAHDTYWRHWSTPIIWGASIQDEDIAARRYAVHSLIDSYNIGFIETQKILTQNIKQVWKKLYGFISRLDLSNQEFILKYRTKEKVGYPTKAFLANWVDATSFNSDSGTQDEFDWEYVSVGDEAMILDGTGRGYSAHVTDVSRSVGVTTVTVDESIGVASDPLRVVFTNYQKIASITTLEEDEILQYTIDQKAPWIQFKLEFRGVDMELNALELTNAVDKSAV